MQKRHVTLRMTIFFIFLLLVILKDTNFEYSVREYLLFSIKNKRRWHNSKWGDLITPTCRPTHTPTCKPARLHVGPFTHPHLWLCQPNPFRYGKKCMFRRFFGKITFFAGKDDFYRNKTKDDGITQSGGI